MLMLFYGVGSWYHLHIGFRQDLIIGSYRTDPRFLYSQSEAKTFNFYLI